VTITINVPVPVVHMAQDVYGNDFDGGRGGGHIHFEGHWKGFLGPPLPKARVMNFPPSKSLKVPKCEIFHRSDFHDFYTIKSLWGRLWG
jgi:hypothetical protein